MFGKSRQNSVDACTNFRQAQRVSRRQALAVGGLGVFGLTLPGLLGLSQSAVASDRRRGEGVGQAKSCILIFAWGGPSQLDTLDLKPDAPAEIRGEFHPIATNVNGIQISEHFPRLAQHADKYAIIRSLTHDDPAHLSSVHHLTTGRHAPRPKSDAEPPSRRDSPAIGSVLSHLRPRQDGLPSFITMPWIVSHPAAPGGVAPGQNAGWLGPGYDPFVVQGDPNHANFRVPGLTAQADMSGDRMQARRNLLQRIDTLGTVASHTNDFHERAFNLLTSRQAQNAFRVEQESPRVRDRYGRNIHGQCLLMARRLIEAGVRLVCINWHQDNQNFWDTHGNNFNRLKNDLMPPTDLGVSALLEDLQQRGLLEETLVVWVGEFGRRPDISRGNAGREHWPFCYSGFLAGGGIRGGMVYGQSDRRAAYPSENPVSPADLTATIYHALGIPAETALHDRQNRPIRITEGNPVMGLFS